MTMSKPRRIAIRAAVWSLLALALPAAAQASSERENRIFELNQEAIALSQQQQYVPAYEKITQAYNLDSTNEVVRDNRIEIGRSLAARRVTQGDFSSGIDLLHALLNLGGPRQNDVRRQLAVTYSNFGVVLCENETFLEADRACNEASHLAYALDEDKLYKQIATVYSQVLTAWAQDWLMQGKGETAKVKLLEAIRYDQTNAVACQLLSKIYFDDGDYRKALQTLDRALELRPNDASLLEQRRQIEQEARLDGDLRSRKQGKFRVDFSGPQEYELAGDVFDILHDARKEIGRLFDFYPSESLLVKVYNNEHRDALGIGPHWAAGLYDGKIRVHVDHIRRGGDALRDVLYHEYAHAVLFYLTRHNIPTWLNEGLAQYVEPGASVTWQEERTVRRWIEQGRYVPITRLPESFVELDAETAQQAYLQSELFTRFLAEGFGKYKLSRLLLALGQGQSLEQAAQDAYRRSLADLERQWIEELR